MIIKQNVVATAATICFERIFNQVIYNQVIIKTRRLRSASFLFVLLILLSACDQTPPAYKLSGATMGTSYNVTLVASDTSTINSAKVNELKVAIDKELIFINQLMSTYIKDSEISRFNNVAVGQWFDISPETLYVINYAQSLSEKTEGKFDITVSPLINLWGFGFTSVEGFPSDESIVQAKEQVGWRSLVIDQKNTRLLKKKPLSIDLSAIAKGYGVDYIAQLVEKNGIDNYLVEIGGEIRVKGLNREGILWRLGIEVPSIAQSKSQQVISLKDRAIATSGDYRNFFEKDGVRYSHTIDPETGKPVIHNIASLTVISDTAMEADALATAMMVLGEDKALAMAIRYNIPIYILLYEDDTFTQVYSPEFKPYLSQ